MTIIPQTEYSDSKYILEQLETLIESVQMGIDCTNPSNADAYAALVHVRAFVRGEPVHDEPNPVSLPDLLKRAESSLEALTCKSGEIYSLQSRLATLEIRVQAQRGALATALARCDELQALADAHKSEADNLQSAFEIAYKRREQLHNDNVDLSTAVVDLNHINQQLAMRLTQVLELFDAHDLLWEIRDEAGARAAREIVKAARELVGKV